VGCVNNQSSVCQDGNPCTKDICDPQKGCQFIPADGAKCDDGNECTLNDKCQNNQCGGTQTSKCDDGDPCTVDVCQQKKGCVSLPGKNGTNCDDGNVCTSNDSCWEGQCMGGKAEKCDDGNVCTTDSCNGKLGCVYKPNNNKCDDDNACTHNDVCNKGICGGGKGKNCDDGNPCTKDVCDPWKGCQNIPDSGAKCDDGNVCTTVDICSKGSCQGHKPVVCDDGNECTKDFCDPQKGCKAKNLSGTSCDDGSVCTQKDSCSKGVCVGASPKKCDDGNVCTTDFCDAKLGCVSKPNDGAKCSDGNVCTVVDSCLSGKCVGGKPKNCDDKDFCTLDSCHPSKGCKYEENPKCKSCPEAVELGAATDYNVFACGDYNGLQDAQGKVAAKGDLTAFGFSVGEINPGGLALVSGGNMDIESGTIFGDGVHGGALNVANVTMVGGSLQQGNPINFAWECKSLKQQAGVLGGLQVNGSTTVTSWGGVLFHGDDADVNIFTVDGDDISSANTVSIDVPNGSIALINVTGSAVTLSSMGMNGFDAARTMWNLPSAQWLTITSIMLPGTVLAPMAETTFDSANIDGQLITGHLMGAGQSHHVPLTPFEVDPCKVW